MAADKEAVVSLMRVHVYKSKCISPYKIIVFSVLKLNYCYY